MEKKDVEPFVGIGCQDLMADGCSHSGMAEMETKTLGLTYYVARYLVLKSGCLYCYSHHTDVKASDQLSLAGYRLSNAPEKKGHAFKLVYVRDSQKKTLVFTVGSAREKDEWITKIQEDIEEYCTDGREAPPYEDVSALEEACDSVYLDPMSRPAAPLPEPSERSRKTQSLYIPRKAKKIVTEQTHKPPPSPTANWPLPPLPGESDEQEVPCTSRRRISDPSRSVPGGFLPQSPPKLPVKPAPKPRPRPQPQPSPTLAPNPAPSTRPLPTRPDENRSQLPRYVSEPQMIQAQLFAGAVDELKEKQGRPVHGHDSQSDCQGPLGGTASQDRPGNKVIRRRTAPDGDSFKRTNPARAPVDPPTSNVLRKDFSSAVTKKMNMQKAAVFLNGKMPGTFILRDSASSESGKAISVRVGETAKHYRIFYKQESGYALSHNGPGFNTIEEVVDYYRYNPLPNS